VVLSELTFLRTKKNKFKDASSSGQITSAMKKIALKLKKGQYFSIIATIQKDGEFQYIEKEWLVQ
ncbi:MAG: hypothetical protein HKN16_09340, partial [Saprospiraceae bacterium]|nr:hypothetical protein [Saprospiraceae bacterium]